MNGCFGLAVGLAMMAGAAFVGIGLAMVTISLWL